MVSVSRRIFERSWSRLVLKAISLGLVSDVKVSFYKLKFSVYHTAKTLVKVNFRPDHNCQKVKKVKYNRPIQYSTKKQYKSKYI